MARFLITQFPIRTAFLFPFLCLFLLAANLSFADPTEPAKTPITKPIKPTKPTTKKELINLESQQEWVPFRENLTQICTQEIPATQKNPNLGDDLNTAYACYALGDLFNTNLGGPQDWQQAFSYYEKSCNLGNAKACYSMAAFLDLGIYRKVNREESARLYEKACEMGHGYSCYEMAHMYDPIYGSLAFQIRTDKKTLSNKQKKEFGKKYQTYKERAFDVTYQVCDQGDLEECIFLAQIYMNEGQYQYQSMLVSEAVGRFLDRLRDTFGGRVDLVFEENDFDELIEMTDAEKQQKQQKSVEMYGKGIKVFERACEWGEMLACSTIGLHTFSGYGDVKPNEKKATTYFKKACEANDGIGCFGLAMSYGLGEGVSIDARRSLLLFNRSCDLGSRVGCSLAGISYIRGLGTVPDVMLGGQWLEKGCTQGDGLGCWFLGMQYEYGDNSRRATLDEYKTANRYYLRACELRFGAGCRSLGDSYLKGNGVVKNEKLAESMYREACHYGDGFGCSNFVSAKRMRMSRE